MRDFLRLFNITIKVVCLQGFSFYFSANFSIKIKNRSQLPDSGFYFIYFSLSTHIDHTRLYRSDFYNISCVRSMNHLTISDINTTMCCCCYNITRLRVTYSCPSHECKCCSETAIASCQTIAYKSGTVETVWSVCTPFIRFSKLAVCSAYD